MAPKKIIDFHDRIDITNLKIPWRLIMPKFSLLKAWPELLWLGREP